MSNFSIYIFQVMVLFTWLLLPFLLLQKDRHFSRNRFYLLIFPLLAFIIPLLHISLPAEAGGETLGFVLHTFSVTPHQSLTAWQQYAFMDYLALGYLLVTLFLVLRLLVRLYRILHLIRISPAEKTIYGNIILMPGKQVCFSFFNYVFVSEDMRNEAVLYHERVHARKLHSLDIVTYELFAAFLWLNPLVWKTRKMLADIHEYQADHEVILHHKMNVNDYQVLLLSSALGCDFQSLANSFSSSTVKKRIFMLTKNENKKAGIKFLLVAPVLLLALLAVNIAFIPAPAKRAAPSLPATGDEVVMPEYPGGMEAMMRFLAENLKYPADAEKNQQEGKVYVSFTVDKKGKVIKVSVKKGFYASCDAEAVRVVSMMPAWKPGTNNGKPSDTEMTLPVSFKLK